MCTKFEMTKDKRNNSLDASCGLMITYMIYGHICLWCNVPQIETAPKLLFFFMPWFFFKSGMYFRPKTFTDTVVGCCRRLLIPYLIFSIIGQIVFSIMWLVDGRTPLMDYFIRPIRTLIHEGAVVGNSPLWFLFTLCIVKLVFELSAMKGIKMTYILWSSLLVSYILNYIGFHDYFYIANASTGCLFFASGYILKDKQYSKWYIILFVCIYILYVYFYPSYFDFRSNTIDNNSYIFCILACIGGIIAVNNIFRFLGGLKFLNDIGKNSMTYYVIHWIVLGLSSLFFRNLLNMSDGMKLFICYCLANIILLPLADMAFNRKMKWMIGK